MRGGRGSQKRDTQAGIGNDSYIGRRVDINPINQEEICHCCTML